MRFGLALPHYDTSFAGRPVSWEAVRDVARAAERAGFDSVWVSDHFFLDWSKYGGPGTLQGSLECWTTLAGVAGTTDKIRIGSLTLCNDFRNPGLLAHMAATLDHLSNGRLEIGLGAGWYEPEYRATGIPFDRPGVRVERLAESLQIVTRLLDGERFDFAGKHYNLSDAVVRPEPAQRPRPPVLVGGKGDRIIRIAVEFADGWNMSWLGPIDTYRERVAYANEACTKAGRDPQSFRKSVGAYVVAGKDEAEAQKRFERLIKRTPKGILDSTHSWEEFRRDRIAGGVSEVIDKLGEFQDAGADEIIVGLGVIPFQVSDLEDVELFGGEIIAGLRSEVTT